MAVIAMQVIHQEEHPNADALRLYTFESPGIENVQVVANLDNLYQPGDIVAVATIGTVLNDGTKIRKSRLRGIDSFGMTMGLVSVPVGTDLSTDYCPEESLGSHDVPNDIEVIKWTSIELLHNIKLQLDQEKERLGGEFQYPQVTYRAKVKLDGTNAGVHILSTGKIIAQSRTRLLTPESDNYGFAQWVHTHQDYFAALQPTLGAATLFGEWCGKGIQKRVAIAKVERRVFVVFAIQYGDHNTESASIDIDPIRIRRLLPEHPDVYVLPWYGEPLLLDFANKDALQASANTLNQMVDEVETVDPWVAEHFGVEGTGEGLVLYPVDALAISDGPIQRDVCTEFIFKAKGEKHRVVRQKKAVQLTPEVANSIDAFVEMFVTPARLEQALTESCTKPLSMSQLSDYLRWLGQDIKKESTAELEASELTWKQVHKPITTAARQWFKGQLGL